MDKTNETLKNLLDANLYSRYSGLLSLSNISLQLIDTNGQILLEFNPSPDFCKFICQEDEARICSDYISRLEPGNKLRFNCRYGLANMLLPVEINNQTIGYVVGAQVYSTDSEYQKYLIDINDIAKDKELAPEFIAKSIAAIRTIEENKIEIHEQICNHITQNISYDFSQSINTADKAIARLSIEKEMLEKKIIDLEAKNMSLLINPHFLFNTLNSIARIAYFEKSHTTEELIYCLSDLLRYNLKQDDELHTIGAEIDNIEKYLYIQKIRFKNRLEYDIDIADNIKPYRIPNMIIQPVVENALIHGITPKRDGGKIKITAEKYKNDINISVMDNGNGFPKEVLQSLQDSENKLGIGFRSTDNRLKRYFGENYGLKIAKSDYSGSTVTISIPTKPNARR
ncbi:histidine kinase [Desulfosporosinus hippei]|uniref:Histidine kinase-, DNA gyrase B-, and HSP90-like ATPase n=1 Tax=Desulfosporosinus hippei DSM 8344 TaxID=1121419 RepID=A0A1G7UAY4_9FIRM|nr:histidine kinase [Desulfosporosinus hippei]SDG44617.1 Histidine kinase-, DNA gyrase B-, and HSP90-like ATPase [Desulfosporosinus hippei DSM 8344]